MVPSIEEYALAQEEGEEEEEESEDEEGNPRERRKLDEVRGGALFVFQYLASRIPTQFGLVSKLKSLCINFHCQVMR